MNQSSRSASIQHISGPELDAVQAIAYTRGLHQTYQALLREQLRRAKARERTA